MREKLRALYYPECGVDQATLIKCILLFDEIHFMDRPSFTFGGKFGMVGMASPLRQYEKSFRKEGVPLYVHQAPGGIVGGELLNAVEADLSDPNFMTRFHEGLRGSPHFRNLHIPPGDYGKGETHETIFHKVAAIDLQHSPSPLEIFNNPDVSHFEYATPEGCLKTLAAGAAFCSVKMNFALEVGVRQGFWPLADASPYADLLSAKYSRAIASAALGGTQIPATDLSLAILDELVPAETLSKISVIDAVKYRNESESARDAFLEHVSALHAKLGKVSEDGDYAAEINRIIRTEVRPAAKDFRNKLTTIRERLFGKVAAGAVVWAGSSATLQVFGDLSWPKLLGLAAAAATYVVPKAVDAFVEKRSLHRDCAISYLLDLESTK
jgi:hypothetical protein